jgi:methionyl-tRNA synthetase
MAAGLPVPKQVWAHGWFLIDAGKMSKSKGNVVLPRPIAQVLGMDALRYYMLRETVFGQDGNFSYDALVTRYNSDLANGLGNLASRVLTMIEQHLMGSAPGKPGAAEDTRDVRINDLRRETILQTCQHYDRFEFSRALEAIWRLMAEVDRYLVETKPWVQVKAPGSYDQFVTTIYTAYRALREVVILAHPILPSTTQQIWKQMGQTAELGTLDIHLDWPPIANARIGKIEAVFPRIEKSEAVERMEAMESEPQKPAVAPAASTTAGASGAAAQTAPEKIAIEDFAKVEMRVGQIKTAERIVGADKLLKLTVDIGSEVRQICAGIAQYYEPEALVGRKVVVVVNLAPRKLRGVESNGMIVAASVGPEGRPVLAAFTEDVEVGARLK